MNLQVLAGGLELVILLNTLQNFRAFRSVINDDIIINNGPKDFEKFPLFEKIHNFSENCSTILPNRQC